MPEHATLGSNHATVAVQPLQLEVDAPTPGRGSAADGFASGTRGGVEIAPDRRDHSRPQELPSEVDVELRTLIAHCERNIALHRAASTQPERDAALEAIDTRVAVALRHVPDGMRDRFRTELFAQIGGSELQRLLARGEGSYGARAASDLGVDRTLQFDREDHVDVPELAPEDAHAIASEGTARGGSALPYLEAIQHSFGHHDVSNVVAHVGGAAQRAASALGARAYASGNSIAFTTAPDLHLAAHEAAHVVQQRSGVSLRGGVGAAGDEYERHADAVADLVVRGEKAEALLDRNGPGAGSPAVQRVAEPRMQLAATIAALGSTMEIESTISQLAAITAPLPAHEYSIILDGAPHRVAGADIRFLLSQARAREQRLARGAVSRATLLAALTRSDRDGLLASRHQLTALGESSTGDCSVELGAASYRIVAADVGWLMARIDERLHAVDSTVAEITGPPAHESAQLPMPGHESSGAEAVSEDRISNRFPYSYQIDTGIGRFTFEGAIEVMLEETGRDAAGAATTHIPAHTPTIETTGRLGLRPRDLTSGASVAETGLIRSTLEHYHHQMWIPGSERISGEFRDEAFRGSIGWDFGGPQTQFIHPTFRVSFLNISTTDGIRGPSLECNVASDWFTGEDGQRTRFRGQVTLRPNWAELRDRLVARRAGGVQAEEAEPELPEAEPPVAEALETDLEADVLEGALPELGAAEEVALASSLELVGVIVLVIGVLAISTALLITEQVRRDRLRRRGAAPPHDGPDAELTAYGNAVHERIRDFCLGYSDVLRGTRRVRSVAGRGAGQERLDQLIAQGHSAADIHTAASALPDLDARVLAAARPAFTRQIDATVADIASQLHSQGASDPQYIEWVTHHLHACIGIELTAPIAAVFRHDICRDDPTTVPSDTTACLDETESNPDAPNPARR